MYLGIIFNILTYKLKCNRRFNVIPLKNPEKNNMKLFKKTKNIILIFLFIAGCTIKLVNHGYVFEEENIKKLKKGETTKSQVLENLGSPSVISSFDKNIWYYIHTKTKQISMLKPKNVNEKILQISFKNNTVNKLYLYEDDQVKSFYFDGDETPVRGDDTGVLKDFMQNLGRFNKSRIKK